MSTIDKGFTVRRAGHLVIRCADPVRTARFFQDVVGFNLKGVVQRGMHFLTSDFKENHHMLLVRPALRGATAQDADQMVGMARISYEITDAEAYDHVVAHLIDANASPELGSRPGCRFVRFKDPDGLPYEFYCRAGSEQAA
ncbi:MAG: catechol 2,3-dioxygenase-like lactoylglutathione lyase family enzyme [Alphaproteobacteria bacterium]|jgi:catechol 2,3-dioxygenase-like lactoylglutathione lyase family enzyme